MSSEAQHKKIVRWCQPCRRFISLICNMV